MQLNNVYMICIVKFYVRLITYGLFKVIEIFIGVHKISKMNFSAKGQRKKEKKEGA